MLDKVTPEKLKTLEEIKRLEFLRDEVIPRAREWDREGRLDLTEWSSCLMCVVFTDFPDQFGISEKERHDYLVNRLWHVSKQVRYALEGPVDYGLFCATLTLDERATAITKMIEHKLNEVYGD